MASAPTLPNTGAGDPKSDNYRPMASTVPFDFKYTLPQFNGSSVPDYLAWKQAFCKLHFLVQVSKLDGSILVTALFHSLQGSAGQWLVGLKQEVFTHIATKADIKGFLELADQKFRPGNTGAIILNNILTSRFNGGL